MGRLWLVWAGLGLLVGCSTGLRPVQKGTLVPRNASIVVVGVDSPGFVEQVLLQRMQDIGTSLSLEQLSADDRVQVFSAPPGTYCLAGVKANGVYYDFNVEEQTNCLSVKYSMSVYLGHLVFSTVTKEPYYRWERRVEATCKSLNQHDPEVLIRLAGSDPDFAACLGAEADEDEEFEDFEIDGELSLN